MFSILLSQLTPDYFYLIICVEKQKRRSAFIDSHRKPADIGVELGVASWQPPHPKNFRPTRNICRPSRNLLTWMASMNFGGQKFQNFCLKAENFEKFLDFGFRERGGYSFYAVRPTRSHMNSTPMPAETPSRSVRRPASPPVNKDVLQNCLNLIHFTIWYFLFNFVNY